MPHTSLVLPSSALSTLTLTSPSLPHLALLPARLALPPPPSPQQPNSSKKKKFYLILFAGQPIVGGKPQAISVPQGLRDEHEQVAFEKRRADADARKKMHRGGGKKKGKRGLKEETKEWVLRKKELYRTRGKEGVPRDSKCVSLSRASAPLSCLPLPRPRRGASH